MKLSIKIMSEQNENQTGMSKYDPIHRVQFVTCSHKLWNLAETFDVCVCVWKIGLKFDDVTFNLSINIFSTSLQYNLKSHLSFKICPSQKVRFL